MTDLSEVMGRLSPATKKRFQKASEITAERLPLASVGLNQALCGGLGYGRQSLVWGNKSSGKSSMLLQTVASAQEAGKSCAFLDVEQGLDSEWAKRLGVDTDQLIVSRAKLARDVTDDAVDLVKSGIDIVIVDSISGITPMSWVNDKDELKGMEGTKQIGSKSRDIGTMIASVNLVNQHTAFILVSQIRNKITSYGAVGQPDGGNAAKFFSSTIVKFTSSASDKEQIKGEYYVGDSVYEGAIGRPVEWLVEFNKMGPPNRSGKYDFYYSGDEIGVDIVGELLDIAVLRGAVEKKAAYYYIDGVTYQGRKAAVNAIKAEPDLQERLVKEIG
jgi:recombination protein RecA